MHDVLLQVRPVAQGWLVECTHWVEPLIFRSGARAEAQAHAVAKSLASAGNDARVVVHDRTHHLVGTTRYFAQEDGATGG